MAIGVIGQKADCTAEEIDQAMAFSNPPDHWQIVGDATWGTDVLEETTTVTQGDYSIKLTGNTPTSTFGLENTTAGYTPVEYGRAYRIVSKVRTSDNGAGRNHIVKVDLYGANKTGLVNTFYAVNSGSTALSAVDTWYVMTTNLGFYVPAAARWAKLSITKDATYDYDFFVDYVYLIAEPMSFHAWVDGDQAISASTYTDVVFDQEEALADGVNNHDLGLNFDTATGLFTAPYRAVYHFSTAVGLEILEPGKYFRVVFRKNGTNYKRCAVNYNGHTSNVEASGSGSITAELDRGDTFGVAVFHNNAVARDVNGDVDGLNSWFSGHEITQ